MHRGPQMTVGAGEEDLCARPLPPRLAAHPPSPSLPLPPLVASSVHVVALSIPLPLQRARKLLGECIVGPVQHRVDSKDQLSIKVVNKGWGGVGNEEICGDAWNSTCPALVLAGTTHVSDGCRNSIGAGLLRHVVFHPTCQGYAGAVLDVARGVGNDGQAARYSGSVLSCLPRVSLPAIIHLLISRRGLSGRPADEDATLRPSAHPERMSP